MDDREKNLMESARNGDVEALQGQLNEEPGMLERARSAHFADSVLHVAALHGNADFVKEVMTRKPSLAREKNQKGMIPLHLASSNGHVETVKELLKAEPDDDGKKYQCRATDDEGKTPLHCASQRGKINVIQELISQCPECLEQKTAKEETALHIAVKANQFEAVEVLAYRIRLHNLHAVLKALDQNGNTTYQLAAAKKSQSQMVQAFELSLETFEFKSQWPRGREGT